MLEDSIAQLERLRGAGGYRSRQIGSLFAALLSRAHHANGEIERAAELAAKALAMSADCGWPVAVGYGQRAAARVAMAHDKLDEAETAVRTALKTFTDCNARAQVQRTRLVLAEILAARGDTAAATEELAGAREAFRHMRVPRLVARTERLAATLGLSLA